MIARSWRRLAIAAVVVTALAGAGALVAFGSSAEEQPPDEWAARCDGFSDRALRITCFSGAFEKLLADQGVEAGIEEIDRIAKHDTLVAQDCHLALHPIGERLGRRLAAEDERLPKIDPGGFCHEGWVHGVMIAYFRDLEAEQVVPVSPGRCGGSDVLRSWSCAHVFGHVYTEQADYDIRGATAGCLRGERSVDPWTMPFDRNTWLSSCVKGAVMEFVMRDLAAKRHDAPTRFCDRAARGARTHCYAFVSLFAEERGGGTSTLQTQHQACMDLAPSGRYRAACLDIWRCTVEQVTGSAARKSSQADGLPASERRSALE